MKIRAFYKDVSLIFFNLVVLFIAVNVLGFIGLQARDLLKMYGGQAVSNNPWVERAKAYPGLKPDQVYRLFMETWEWRDYGYVPVSQFGEKPYSGKYVNVTKAGFRKGITESPWPPPGDGANVFVFGGSTTFGYGLADWQTVPSNLSEMLNKEFGGKVNVYNFGRAYFYSNHEVLEFLRLLSAGHRPDVAIFIDGLNEFYYQKDDLIWTDRLKRLTEEAAPSAWRSALALGRELPAYKFIYFLIRYFGKEAFDPAKQAAENVHRIASGGGPEASNRIINRYLKNKSLAAALGRHFGVKTLFVWQPVPTYKYDLKYHLFSYKGLGQHVNTGGGYEAAQARYDKGNFGANMAWCADIQKGLQKPLYVDAVHYGRELSRLLADCVLEKTILRDVIRAKVG